MRRKTIPRIAALALAAGLAAPAAAQVNFNSFEISEPLTVSQIETLLGVANTQAIEGVALGPGSTIFIVHLDNNSNQTIAHIDLSDLDNPAAAFTKSAADIAADLGAPYDGTANFPILVSEFVWDPTANVIYFADSSVAGVDLEYALLALDVGSATQEVSEVLRSEDIFGLHSHGTLADGTIVANLGEEREDFFPGEEASVGLIDPSAPSYELIYDEDDFLAAGPAGADELPPESIAVDPTNDDVYVFCHDDKELFVIRDIQDAAERELVWLDIEGWGGIVDIHGLSVDSDSNLYGFDEESEALVIWTGAETNDLSAASTFSLSFDDIAEELRGTGAPEFEPEEWRGIKARKINDTQAEVWLSSKDSSYGVVRVLFGDEPTSVHNWMIMN